MARGAPRKVTGATRTDTTTDALAEECVSARIHGGAFPLLDDGRRPATQEAAAWALDHHFGKRMVRARCATAMASAEATSSAAAPKVTRIPVVAACGAAPAVDASA